MMAASPYHPDIVAQARHLISHAEDFQYLSRDELVDLLQAAWSVLRGARAATRPAHPLAAPCRVITIPRAVFQSHRRPATLPVLILFPHTPTYPGDAA